MSELKYKSYLDFEWKPHYPNNIPRNGQDGWRCEINPREWQRRVYYIRFQYTQSEYGLILNQDEPELYILFENETFIYAFKMLEEAKKRAYTQYAHIYGYVASFLPKSETITINEGDF